MQMNTTKPTGRPQRTLHRALALGFVLLVVTVPVLQGVGDWSAGRPPSALRLYADLSGAVSGQGLDDSEAASLIQTNAELKQALDEHGQALALDSPVRQCSFWTVGRLWPGWLDAHDGRYVIGRDGWVYHRPDLDWVIGRGFLSAHDADDSGPLRAIRAFHHELKAHGIHLVVVPVPVKPTIHPEGLARTQTPISNIDMEAFKRWTSKESIDLYDPAGLLNARLPGGPQYLKTDTHWRPEAMSAVAEDLAAHIEPRLQRDGGLTPVPYVLESRVVDNIGDTARSIPGRSFEAEEVTLQRVLTPEGNPWSSDDDSPVVLLGDSFASIYSDPTMQWGGSAGLPEQLSRRLGVDVQAIVINGGGANETRHLLIDQLRSNPFRRQNIKVVVWEFAARDMMENQWDVIGLPE